MVNSGAGGAKQERRPASGPRLVVSNIQPIMLKHLVPVNYSDGTPGDVAASGSSLVLPRAVAGTRGQYSTLHYAGASIVRCAMQGQQRGRRRGGEKGGTGERAKEAARTVGGKETGAWVIGG
jgi:hypothetical protein